MNTLKELGDQWEREALAGIREKRDRLAQSAAACKEGGEYGAQILRVVAMYDRMISAASAQPVSAGLTDAEIVSLCADAGLDYFEPTKDFPGFFGIARMDEMRALLSAAQRDSQPDTSADARDAGHRCDDCPPIGYPTDETRCVPCDRRAAIASSREGK